MEGEKKDWEEMLNGRQVVLSAGLFREFQEKAANGMRGFPSGGDRRSIGGGYRRFPCRPFHEKL